MQKSFKHLLLSVTAFAALAVPASALTVNLDGTTYTRLSDAVTAVYASDDDGDDIINITVNSITLADVQTTLTKPITINGDGENNGAGDGTPCDILVDTLGMQAASNIGITNKAYLEITAPGAVNISDIRLHPNTDGPFTTTNSDIIMGIICGKPPAAEDVGTYTFTNVEFSGSDSSNGNAFVEPDTGNDLYNQAGIYKWAGKDGSDGNIKNYGIIQLNPSGGAGVYNTVFDHCKSAVTFGVPLNISTDAGTHQVLGGLYGHCARDGIHVQSPGVTIKGTYEDRVRILRTTNIGGTNSHGLEVQNGGVIDLIEYVDIAGMNTVNSLSLQNGSKIDTIRFVRGMGKFNPEGSNNQTVYITGAETVINNIENCTFHANGLGNSGLVPMAIQPTIVSPITVKDCIFTSDFQTAGLPDTSGTLTIGAVDAGAPMFINCALPTDGLIGESLSTEPIDGGGTWTVTNAINSSPQYLLTLADYDWSDAQGEGKAGNAVGNANVFRPNNPAYATASSAGRQLNGGAGGEPLSGINPSEWMLMQ